MKKLLLAISICVVALLGRPAISSAEDPAPRPSAQAVAPRAPAALPTGEARARATPRRAFAKFLEHAQQGDFDAAAHSLDLRHLPASRRAREGAELAAMLYRVLAWRVPLDPDTLPDEPDPEGVGAEGIELDRVELEGGPHSLSLARIRGPSGPEWLFPRGTVEAIRPTYTANERRWLEDRVPEVLRRPSVGGLVPWQWIGLLALAGLAYVVGRVLGQVTIGAAGRLAARWSERAADLTRSIGRGARLALGTATFTVLVPWLLLPAGAAGLIERVTNILYVAAAAWAGIALVRVGTEVWEDQLPEDTAGQLASRGLRTRLTMVRRIATVLVAIVAGGVALLQFEVVRSVGVSLLASAGIAGVLVGFAAQRTLGGIVSGIEMSITQPLRIGDVVVFQGEVGTVEQIYFTYVVVRLWDERCMIVPVGKVMSDAFQNWTRSGAQLLAPVDLWVDFAAPIEPLREAFARLCEASPLWDARLCKVQVVEITDKAIRLRGLASVDTTSKAFDLRCELREGWLRVLQQLDDGRYLPRGRVESTDDPRLDPLANAG